MDHRKIISQEFDTNGLLSDQRYTELWIGWYNGLVEAGTGTVVGQEVCNTSLLKMAHNILLTDSHSNA